MVVQDIEVNDKDKKTVYSSFGRGKSLGLDLPEAKSDLHIRFGLTTTVGNLPKRSRFMVKSRYLC
jgi:hypothetical protein